MNAAQDDATTTIAATIAEQDDRFGNRFTRG